MGKHPSQQSGSGLTATRLRHIRMVKSNPLGRQQIQCGSLYIRISVATKFGPIVFGDNKENIRSFGFKFQRLAKHNKKQQKNRKSRLNQAHYFNTSPFFAIASSSLSLRRTLTMYGDSPFVQWP